MARMMIAKTSRLLWCALMILSASATIAPCAHAQPLPCRYEVVAVIQAPPVGPLPSPLGPTAISPNGRYIVGWVSLGLSKYDRAFVYNVDATQFMLLPSPSGVISSYPHDVTDSGLVVGQYEKAAGTFGFVFDLTLGQYTLELASDVPHGWCTVVGIDGRGTIVGTRTVTGEPDFYRTAFRWTAPGGFQELGKLMGSSTSAMEVAPDGAIAVAIGFGNGAYLWDGKQSTNVGSIKGSDGLTPRAIAESGHVVGRASFIDGNQYWSEPFEFRNGVLRLLPILDRTNKNCFAEDVNSAGVIVGGCRPLGGQQWTPCVWTDNGVIDLRSRATAASHLFLDAVGAISDAGRIVCGASPNGLPVAVVLEPVAEVTGDTNCDQRVDVDDLINVILQWGSEGISADVTHDGVVALEDLLLVIESWTF